MGRRGGPGRVRAGEDRAGRRGAGRAGRAGGDGAGAAAALPVARSGHGACRPPVLAEPVAAAGLTVVTQPHFLAERGDAYLRDVEPDDLPWLYRCAGLLAAGIPLAAGTDAPFGGADPWASMRAAVRRRAPSGQVMGPGETL